MWPLLLDMTKEESMQHLRCLEIDAFSGLVNALRAQGSLNKEKLNLLKETSNMLHISQERHKAEIRRVVNDERLNTIAYHVNGERHCGEEWADEGQRLIPLMPRVAPQTAYSAIADEVADATSKLNKQLPLPASTDRKRVTASPTHCSTSATASSTSQNLYRGGETERKRKLSHSMSMDNCVLAQHLMAPPKISKIQQIYRQKSMSKLKEQLVKLIKPSETISNKPDHPQMTKIYQKPTPSGSTPSKVNIIQNITASVPQKATSTSNDPKNDARPSHECKVPKTNDPSMPHVKTNLAQRPPVMPATISASSVSSTSNVPHPTTPIPNTSKTITTTDGQKLIVVSTHSSLTPNSSILQRTLTTIPLKTVNPKYRLVSRDSNTMNCAASRQAAMAAGKQKMAAMRGAPNRRVVPYSNVQVLNTPGGLKVVAGRKPMNVPKQHPMHLGHPAHIGERLKHIKPTLMKRNEVGGKLMKEYPKQVINISIGNAINKAPRVLPKEANTTIEVKTNAEGNGNCHEVNEVNGIEDAIDGAAMQDTSNVNCNSEPQGTKDIGSNVENSLNETKLQNGAETSEVTSEMLHCDDAIPMSDEDASTIESKIAVENAESEQSAGTENATIDTNGENNKNPVVETQPNVIVENIHHMHEDEDNEVHNLNDNGKKEDILQETVVYEEKVDLDSSVFIYDNDNQEVIIEGIADQPIEVLNAVHTLDESFSNLKNVRS